MKIGELAEGAGIPVETVRYYEKAGLLPPAPRTEGNYRQYGAPHLARLHFIRRCRALDMSLAETAELLALIDAPHGDCSAVNHAVASHLTHVRERLAELRRLEKQLSELRALCTGTADIDECKIVAELSIPTASPKQASRRHGKSCGAPVHAAALSPRRRI